MKSVLESAVSFLTPFTRLKYQSMKTEVPVAPAQAAAPCPAALLDDQDTLENQTRLEENHGQCEHSSSNILCTITQRSHQILNIFMLLTCHHKVFHSRHLL